MTHQECCDGAACAILFIEAGGRPENVRYVPAGGVERWIKKDPEHDISSGRFLVFADLGVASSRLAGELEKRGNVVLLDHHKTSLHLSERSWCWIEMEACGAKLLLDYLGLTDPWWNEFAVVIEDHDRWLQRQLPLSRELVELMTFVGQREFVRRMADWPLRIVGRRKGAPFTEAERFVLDHGHRQTQARIASALKRVVKVDREWGRTAYVVTGEPYISELLQSVLIDNPDCVLAAQVNLEKGTVSMRSRPGFDCERVARQFGGGGHAQASAHPLPQGLLAEIAEGVH